MSHSKHTSSTQYVYYISSVTWGLHEMLKKTTMCDYLQHVILVKRIHSHRKAGLSSGQRKHRNRQSVWADQLFLCFS